MIKIWFIVLQSLMMKVDMLEAPVNALKETAAELDEIICEHSKVLTSHTVSSLWQRWTQLRSVARAQKRALEDTARDWRNFIEKVGKNHSSLMSSLWVSLSLVAQISDSTDLDVLLENKRGIVSSLIFLSYKQGQLLHKQHLI